MKLFTQVKLHLIDVYILIDIDLHIMLKLYEFIYFRMLKLKPLGISMLGAIHIWLLLLLLLFSEYHISRESRHQIYALSG